MNNVGIVASSLLSSQGDNVATKNSILAQDITTTIKLVEGLSETISYPYHGFLDDTTDLKSKLFRVVEDVILESGLSEDAICDMAIFLGTSTLDGSVAHTLRDVVMIKNYKESLAYERVGNGYYAQQICEQFSINGLSFTYNTACTSSANALLDASMMINSGDIKHALVIGVESFSQITLDGFSSMMMISQKQILPFDKKREGMVLGESVSAVILSSDSDSSWIFRGGDSSCETHSMTGPNEDGVKISDGMQSALDIAKVESGEITLIKAHGTASQLNDLAEVNALKRVFSTLPPFGSLKPFIGHTLGSCGVSELVVFMALINEGIFPKSTSFTELDEALDVRPNQYDIMLRSGLFLLNYIGFGGNNTFLVVQKKL